MFNVFKALNETDQHNNTLYTTCIDVLPIFYAHCEFEVPG